MKRKFYLLVSLALLLLSLGLPAGAQETDTTIPVPTSLSVSSPYVGVAVKPGDSATFDITVASPPGDRVSFTLGGVPEGWTAELRGGGFVVDAVQVGPTGQVSLELQVEVPDDATEGDYGMTLSSRGSGGSDELDLAIRVAATVGGEVTMTTDFPNLQGASDATFSFDMTIANNTPGDIQFGLSATGPDGWVVDMKPSGEAQASTVTVAAGGTEQVNVSVDPPDDAPAGEYLVNARAEGGGQSVEVPLSVKITGSFDVDLTTGNQALNVSVKANQASSLQLVVTNLGTGPLSNVQMSATPPTGWDVSFDTPIVDVIAPGEQAQVNASITPSSEAINGDYVVSFSAAAEEASADMDVRATVETSAVWGLVGIGVIIAALVGLSMVFRRYGRR